MAIVKNLPGFEVAIVANGKPLTEYINNSEPDQDRKTTRYIEAISDQIFEVHITARRGAKVKGGGLGADIYVDGQNVDMPLLRKSNFRSGDHVAERKGKRVSKEMVQPFCFASLETAQDARAFNGEIDKLKELGTIRIELEFVRSCRRAKDEFKPGSTEELGILSEKALALQDRPMSHGVKYKSAVKHGHRATWSTTSVDASGNSTCNIVFHYASKTSLQYAGIITRTPSPPPLEEKDELTLEEVKQLQAQMRERKRKDRDYVEIKREQEEVIKSKRARKTARPQAGDTQLVLGEGGSFAQQSTAHLGSEEQVPIELSSGEEDDED